MKFHIYGQRSFIDLPSSTTIQDLRSLAAFNRLIRNYLMMLKLKKNLLTAMTEKTFKKKYKELQD